MWIKLECPTCGGQLGQTALPATKEKPFRVGVHPCPECAKTDDLDDLKKAVVGLALKKITALECKLKVSRSRGSGSYWKDQAEKGDREIEKLKHDLELSRAVANLLDTDVALKEKNKGLRTRISSLETALKKSKGNAASLVEEHEEEFHR